MQIVANFWTKFSNFCKISWKHFEHLSNKIWTKTTQVVFLIGLFQTTHFKNTLESFSKCFRIKWFKSVFRITLWRVTEYILLFLKFSSKQSGFSNLISLSTFEVLEIKHFQTFYGYLFLNLNLEWSSSNQTVFFWMSKRVFQNSNQNFWNVSNITFCQFFLKFFVT